MNESTRPSLNTLGLLGRATCYIEAVKRRDSIYKEISELRALEKNAENAVHQLKIELGEQVIHHHGMKPLNIAMGDNSILRVEVQPGYKADSARITHERLT